MFIAVGAKSRKDDNARDDRRCAGCTGNGIQAYPMFKYKLSPWCKGNCVTLLQSEILRVLTGIQKPY